MTEHPNVLAVRDALRSADLTAEVVLLPEAVHTAAAAATALDVEVGQIANSLVFAAEYDTGTEPLLVLTSGAHRVDTDRLAGRIGAVAVRRAGPEFVRTHTGQPIGGVAPVGHPAAVRTVVDSALAGYDRVWAAGGVPRAVFPTTFDELLRLTGGTPVEVT